jgi:hypothetical protein
MSSSTFPKSSLLSDVPSFFYEVEIDKWSPEAFAMHRTTVSMKDYTEGLRKIHRSGTDEVCRKAGALKTKLNTEAGRASMTVAEATLQAKLAQQQASTAALTFQKSLEASFCNSLTKGMSLYIYYDSWHLTPQASHNAFYHSLRCPGKGIVIIVIIVIIAIIAIIVLEGVPQHRLVEARCCSHLYNH